jgi:pimeloyl-ACP methyl ester carboxylesterase
MCELHSWLRRIGYRSAYSGIGYHADCPNLLMETLHGIVGRLFRATSRKVHVVAYSVGGLLAHVLAVQAPERITSVIMLGTPIRGIWAHPSLLFLADQTRAWVRHHHGSAVQPECLTGSCTCEFMEYLNRDFPASVRLTAVYSKYDGALDGRCCRTGDPEVDCEVESTHVGLKFHPYVYSVIARSLAARRE